MLVFSERLIKKVSDSTHRAESQDCYANSGIELSASCLLLLYVNLLIVDQIVFFLNKILTIYTNTDYF